MIIDGATLPCGQIRHIACTVICQMTKYLCRQKNIGPRGPELIWHLVKCIYEMPNTCNKSVNMMYKVNVTLISKQTKPGSFEA